MPDHETEGRMLHLVTELGSEPSPSRTKVLTTGELVEQSHWPITWKRPTQLMQVKEQQQPEPGLDSEQSRVLVSGVRQYQYCCFTKASTFRQFWCTLSCSFLFLNHLLRAQLSVQLLLFASWGTKYSPAPRLSEITKVCTLTGALIQAQLVHPSPTRTKVLIVTEPKRSRQLEMARKVPTQFLQRCRQRQPPEESMCATQVRKAPGRQYQQVALICASITVAVTLRLTGARD